jgi:hypothetical protein
MSKDGCYYDDFNTKSTNIFVSYLPAAEPLLLSFRRPDRSGAGAALAASSNPSPSATIFQDKSMIAITGGHFILADGRLDRAVARAEPPGPG